jgi:hypothetical protein
MTQSNTALSYDDEFVKELFAYNKDAIRRMATTRSFLLPDNESIWQMPVNQSIWYELQIKSHEPDPKFKAMTERVLITSLPYTNDGDDCEIYW